jgi:4-oxalocrotonate tautomerase
MVRMDYVNPAPWLIGGRSLAEQGVGSFLLDLKVREGTTTKDEKAASQPWVFAQLGELFGPLHPPSYVQVHDVRAIAGAYAGLPKSLGTSNACCRPC